MRIVSRMSVTCGRAAIHELKEIFRLRHVITFAEYDIFLRLF